MLRETPLAGNLVNTGKQFSRRDSVTVLKL